MRQAEDRSSAAEPDRDVDAKVAHGAGVVPAKGIMRAFLGHKHLKLAQTFHELSCIHPKSAYVCLAQSTVTPSAKLEPPAYPDERHGSGTKNLTEPSFALPIRIPRLAPRL